jgi:FkbM family methyltransferase
MCFAREQDLEASPVSTSDGPRPLHLRAVRAALRPLALPILNRLKAVIRSAVDEALPDLSGRIGRIEEHLRGTAEIDSITRMDHARMLDKVNFDLQRLLDAQQATEAAVAGVRHITEAAQAETQSLMRMAHTETRQLIEAKHTETRQLIEATDSKTRRSLEKTDIGIRRLQIGTDAIRLDQLASMQALANAKNTMTDLLGQRFVVSLGEDVLMRIPEGYLLVPTEDAALIAAIRERADRPRSGMTAVIEALLRPGDVMLDAAAQIGLCVIPAARKVGPSGRVIALEPASRAAGLLRRNLALNGLDAWVTLHRFAAGEAAGRGALNPDTGRTEEVDTITLDELVEPGTPVRLVKIGLEALELRAWHGMRRISAENPDLALLVPFGPEPLRQAVTNAAEWMGDLTGAGFEVFEIEEGTGSLRAARPMPVLAEATPATLLMLRQPPGAYPELRLA